MLDMNPSAHFALKNLSLFVRQRTELEATSAYALRITRQMCCVRLFAGRTFFCP